MEVRGVEPLSETASPELLRVYPAFDLGRGTPTGGLIPNHPFGSAPCGGRAEPPAAWPAKLCLGAQQTSALRHRGRYVRRRERNRCSQLLFFPVFLRGQRESTTRNPTSTRPVETGSPPMGCLSCIYYRAFSPKSQPPKIKNLQTFSIDLKRCFLIDY